MMDDATQKLVDEARSLTPPGRVAFTSHERMMHRLADALEAAQRPPVSPEQREAVAQAVMGALGCEVLDDTCECDYPCSHGLYAHCKTHDWEVVFNPGAPCPMAARVTDALLARFSFPTLDPEKVARVLAALLDASMDGTPLTSADGCEPTDVDRRIAEDLIARLPSLVVGA